MDGKESDEDEERQRGSVIKNNYEKNRSLFLLQSVLLGISYAIVWPTLWMYIGGFKLNLPTKKLLYGAVFVAYPISSMISAYFVEKTNINTNLLFKLLNLAEIIGNLIFSLNFHPILPFIGRCIAGMGDAFYVVIMKDTCRKAKVGSVASECLAAFILGLIVAQPLNALTLLIPFKLGDWKVNSSNYPGLTASILFILMALMMRFFLSVEDGNKVYDNKARKAGTDKLEFSIDMMRDWRIKALFIATFSFLHTYLVSLFEIIIPMILYEKFRAAPLSSMLLYAFMSLLYALILMLTVTVKYEFMLEIFLVFSVVLKMVALFGILCLLNGQLTLAANIVCLVLVMIVITVMWSNDDVMYNSLIATMIPIQERDFSHNLRKSTSKVAFVAAGISVPFLYSSVFVYIGPLFVCLLGLFFIVFIMIQMFGRADKRKK